MEVIAVGWEAYFSIPLQVLRRVSGEPGVIDIDID